MTIPAGFFLDFPSILLVTFPEPFAETNHSACVWIHCTKSLLRTAKAESFRASQFSHYR